MIGEIHPNTLIAVKKRHRKQASSKQRTAIALHAQGLSKAESARRAGYSATMIKNPQQIFTSQAITTVVDKFKLQLEDVGLTTEYIAIKLKDMLEATKKSDKDYLTQLNALKMLKEILVDQDLKQKKDTPSRRVTIEEFIGTPAESNTSIIEPSHGIMRQDIMEGEIERPHVSELFDETPHKEEELII